MLLVSIHVFGSDDLSSNPAGIVIIFLFLDKKMKTSVKEAVFHSQTKTVKVCEVGLDGIRTCDLSYLGLRVRLMHTAVVDGCSAED